jgi:hypothetical protein
VLVDVGEPTRLLTILALGSAIRTSYKMFLVPKEAYIKTNKESNPKLRDANSPVVRIIVHMQHNTGAVGCGCTRDTKAYVVQNYLFSKV